MSYILIYLAGLVVVLMLMAGASIVSENHESLARTVMGDMGNQREPLTTLQINALVGDVYRNCGNKQPSPEIIVRAIERAHGIGA